MFHWKSRKSFSNRFSLFRSFCFFFFLLIPTWTTELNIQYVRGKRQKDSDIVEELFKSLCANFYPYLSVSCCRCYWTSLRVIFAFWMIAILKWNENLNKYLVLKFLFAYVEIKWPQTSGEIVIVLCCIRHREDCVICGWTRGSRRAACIIVWWLQEYEQIEHRFWHSKCMVRMP